MSTNFVALVPLTEREIARICVGLDRSARHLYRVSEMADYRRRLVERSSWAPSIRTELPPTEADCRSLAKQDRALAERLTRLL